MQNHQPEFSKGKEISKGSLVPPVLSDYMNYRQFLGDFYLYKRKASKGSLRAYTYAVFSAAANIKSPNYLKMIIEGKRNLSDDMIGKFGKALGFMKDQTEEFRLLVQFTQAMDPAERNMYLKKLSEHRVAGKLKSGEIDRKTWEKVPNWVAWIIYAMIDQEGVSFDTATLKNLLRGKASEDEIDHALSTLIGSGDLRRDEVTGELKKARNLTESPEEIPVALVRKLQSQLMYLGLESLYQDQPTEREFGTLTLSLTKTEFEEIKFKLRQMRKALHKDNSIARMKDKGERVYQLNIQLFPVTNAVESAVKAPVMKSSLDIVTETPIVETPVVAAVAVEQAPAVPVAAAPAAPAAAKDQKNDRSNVSSLAATAASAADLFR
ncbi:TIGR02147 family protein [Bdellovibrio bacteriovorus]|uniref:TIGR02147 family protein n=1 Tax=Bdellovibrio bacteriovorus TaxID=959 RepID=UPI0021D10F1A|nr:TIGR02147 family protein [Bdellovibrio bacteriovorus]UXR65921.1 TIGR02147 family protein [Bdellovibrio bacteriovorus]